MSFPHLRAKIWENHATISCFLFLLRFFLVHRHDFFILLNNYHWLFHLQAPFQMIRSFPYRISSSFHSICALVVFTANLLCQAHLLKWVKIIIHPFLAAWYDYFSVISALLFEKTIITYNVSSSLILASCLHFCVSLSEYNCDDVLLRIF